LIEQGQDKMPTENEKCSKPAADELDSTCRLATLKKRSQLDFEIDFFERILSRDPNYVEVLTQLGELFSEKGCYRRALQVDLRLSQLRPRSDTVMYNLACSYAMLNQGAEALSALRRAIALGFSDAEFLLADSDLASLHDHPGFHRLVAHLAGMSGAQHVI
jgi:tetratricopeptide (TPR) repeat protein